jgi:tRNA-dihydrouridine synthase B
LRPSTRTSEHRGPPASHIVTEKATWFAGEGPVPTRAPAVLRVRGLLVDPPLVLAPMAGLTHTAFRRLVVELGGVGLLSTEMLSARSLAGEDPSSPYLKRTPSERPLSHQLLVSAPKEVRPAVDVLHRLGAEAVDLNMGCPASEARNRGGGSRLMEHPDRARAVTAEARKSTSLPLTAKIRLGERLHGPSLRAFCAMLEGEGVDMITVHARLRAEPYGRRPRWEWVGKVKSWVSVPVLANGGIFGAEDARRCLSVSGCDGLMIGRGAAVTPWIFSEIASKVFGWPLAREPLPARPVLYRRFTAFLVDSFPPERRLGRLKEFTHYFSQTYPFGHNLASALQSSRSLEQALERAEAFFRRNEDP